MNKTNNITNSNDAKTDTTEMQVIHDSRMNNEMNLLSAFRSVLKKCQKKVLSNSYFESAKDELDFIGNKLGVTDMEATILAVIVNIEALERCDNATLCSYLGIDGMMFMTLEKDIQNLIKKRLVFKGCRIDNDPIYTIPGTLREAIISNEGYTAPSRKCTNEKDFFLNVNNLFDKKWDKIIDSFFLREECIGLLNENQHIPFVKTFIKLAMDLDDSDIVLFLLFCIHIFRGRKFSMCVRDWSFLYDIKFEVDMVENSLIAGNSPFIINKLLEPKFDNGIEINYEFGLTEKCQKKLFPGMVRNADILINENILSYKKIDSKLLFFNPEIQSQVDTLTSLLSPKRFNTIRKKMKDCGMKGGFCCLFFGEAGAGKTELVKQLAKQTGRDLFQVDLSQIRSKWVGESEKNIQDIFDQYKVMLSHTKRQPILLFNEADAIMGRRFETTKHAVDKMENSISNIILQNMEDFDDGILIATTNLAEKNLDAAYERRFLYKLRFARPNLEVRHKIWCSMLSDVDVDVLARLSQEFNFTGGQIVNIKKKKMIDEILYGDRSSYADLKDYCEQESISTPRPALIGFK